VQAFWIGAMKNWNTNRWYWTSTRNIIQEFFWGPEEPGFPDIVVENMCINFNAKYDWDDAFCAMGLLGSLCE